MQDSNENEEVEGMDLREQLLDAMMSEAIGSTEAPDLSAQIAKELAQMPAGTDEARRLSDDTLSKDTLRSGTELWVSS